MLIPERARVAAGLVLALRQTRAPHPLPTKRCNSVKSNRLTHTHMHTRTHSRCHVSGSFFNLWGSQLWCKPNCFKEAVVSATVRQYESDAHSAFFLKPSHPILPSFGPPFRHFRIFRVYSEFGCINGRTSCSL